MLDYDDIINNKEIFNIFGSESIIYADKLYVYKIFKSLNRSYLRNKFYKVNILSSISGLDSCVLPLDNIMDEKVRFRGYSALKQEGITLADLFVKKGIYEFLLGIIDSSLKLSSIHDRNENIILGDVNCSNIILRQNESGKYQDSVFVDIDNASVDGLKYDNFSGSLLRFYKPRTKNMRISKNTDRLTQLLYLLTYLFDSETIYEIDIFEYDKKTEEIRSLKNIRNLFIRLKDFNRTLPTIPYVYEIISEDDVKKLGECRGLK